MRTDVLRPVRNPRPGDFESQNRRQSDRVQNQVFPRDVADIGVLQPPEGAGHAACQTDSPDEFHQRRRRSRKHHQRKPDAQNSQDQDSRQQIPSAGIPEPNAARPLHASGFALQLQQAGRPGNDQQWNPDREWPLKRQLAVRAPHAGEQGHPHSPRPPDCSDE